MDNRRIIIILLAIIVVLLVCILALINPLAPKTDSVITITSADTLNDGDSFSLLLTDDDSTPLANQNVKVVFIDDGGSRIEKTITTDSSGNAILEINNMTAGTYTVEVSFDGGFKYASCSLSQTVNINMVTTSSSSSAGDSGQTISLELTNYDEYVTEYVGDYKIEAMKWTGSSIGGLGVWVYKDGVMLDRYSYSSRAYICMDGQWKWTNWDSGEEDCTYHKYPVSNDVIIQTVEVRIK